jgi:hypothetical protein
VSTTPSQRRASSRHLDFAFVLIFANQRSGLQSGVKPPHSKRACYGVRASAFGPVARYRFLRNLKANASSQPRMATSSTGNPISLPASGRFRTSRIPAVKALKLQRNDVHATISTGNNPPRLVRKDLHNRPPGRSSPPRIAPSKTTRTESDISQGKNWSPLSRPERKRKVPTGTPSTNRPKTNGPKNGRRAKDRRRPKISFDGLLLATLLPYYVC